MGVTQHSKNLVVKYSEATTNGEPTKMLEYGAQNTYFGKLNTGGNHFYWSKDFFTGIGYDHTSIDLNELHYSIPKDLSAPIKWKEQYDIVTDFGTSEHVTDLYNALKNAYNACKLDGIVIHENPKTGHWLNHGIHYFSQEFWQELSKLAGYEILELGEVGAHGNTKTGMNVYVVFKKVKDKKFPSKTKFAELPIFDK